MRKDRIIYALLLFLVFLLFSISGSAQVPVQIAPTPYAQFLDDTGNPVAGGQLFTYAAGTNTQQATYVDSTGTAVNPNPIILDSAGRASIWLTSQSYKFVLESSMGSVYWVQDNVSVGVFANGNTTFTGNNTFTGATTFSGPVLLNNGGALSGTFTGDPNFSGNPTFSGNPIFTNGIVTSFVQSSTGTAATIGFVRMTTSDGSCWRNFGNTANLCFSLDSGNQLSLPSDVIKGTVGNSTLSITGATGSASNGEAIALTAGAGASAFTGGTLALLGGVGTGGGSGGALSITAGSAFGVGNGGNVTISPGASTGGTNGSIIFKTGISRDGGGGSAFKHARQDQLVPMNSTVELVITWPTPFSDGDYTPVCTVTDGVTGAADPSGLILLRLKTWTATQLGGVIQNTSVGTDIDGILNCIAVHD